MAISTYAELQTAIADWLNRDDLTTTIPTFIDLAESTFNRGLRHWRLESRSNAEIDDQYLTLPTDWQETIRVTLLGDQPSAINLISRDEMQDMRFKGDDVGGKPMYYAHIAGELELYPTPDATYDVELLYYAKPDALSDSNTTNVVLDNWPELYLNGSLVRAANYLRDPERSAEFAQLYNAILQGIEAESRKSVTSGSGLKLNIRSY